MKYVTTTKQPDIHLVRHSLTYIQFQNFSHEPHDFSSKDSKTLAAEEFLIVV